MSLLFKSLDANLSENPQDNNDAPCNWALDNKDIATAVIGSDFTRFTNNKRLFVLSLKRSFYNFLIHSFYYIARSFKWYTKEIASRWQC